MLEEQPRYGVYYDRYEPAFYTGFAPRTLDPRRLHYCRQVHQQRLAVVAAGSDRWRGGCRPVVPNLKDRSGASGV